MNLTKEEILNKEYLVVETKSDIFKAMDEYAEQEAKSFANWLSYQVTDGKTISKLWIEYRESIC